MYRGCESQQFLDRRIAAGGLDTIQEAKYAPTHREGHAVRQGHVH